MSQSRKVRGRKTEAILADYYNEHGWAAAWGTAAQRLSARLVVTASDCWLWQGAKNAAGYGKIGVGSRTDGSKRVVGTHRLAWELRHGPIPPDICVCHHCDVRLCCNPEHHFLGTRAENIADMDAKGRRVNTPHPGERNGRAVLTEEQVRHIRSSPATGAALAVEFGMHKSTICAIRRRKLWRDVA